MTIQGYYRYPTIHADTVVFVSEDDLWTVPAGGGVAQRLTANLGTISFPSFSPDGATLAFTGREEGHSEVYSMPGAGGPIRRLSYLGVNSNVMGWTPDGSRILFASDEKQPFDRIAYVRSISIDGGQSEIYPVGPAVSISVKSDGRTVIGRNNNDPARWKRYRGGTAGDIWVDSEGHGNFKRLLKLNGNVARPMWIDERIYFLSDHEGLANIYSCTADGQNLLRHTDHRDYFARFPSTDGSRIVYHAGADLYVYDPTDGKTHKIEVDYHSPRVQQQRKFVDAARHLESYTPHPLGHSLAINVRGKSYTFGNFEGAARSQGDDDSPIRYRQTAWLHDGAHVVTVTDIDGVDVLEVHSHSGITEPVRIDGLDIGRPMVLLPSPVANQVILSNHRNELIYIDLTERTMQICDRNPYQPIMSMDWAPDGRWVAYSCKITQYQTAIKLWDRTTGETHTVTQPVLNDDAPAFDPEGKYLYFIGARELNPVYDSLHFELGFPRGNRPYLITLRRDLLSPFVAIPRPLHDTLKPEPKKEETSPEEEATGETSPASIEPVREVKIDLENIHTRIVAFPVALGNYTQIAGIKNKALFVSTPIQGALDRPSGDNGTLPGGTLESYDFRELKHETLVGGVSDFAVSLDRKTVVYRSGRKLRVVRAGEKPDEKAGAEPGRKSGYVDMRRFKTSIVPATEWRQMARETWRLQREYFWTEDMSQIDWMRIWERYEPLIDRVGTRGEFSDLMWEMQGELGTSHAYEMGGDYRSEPVYPMGFLGADLDYDKEVDAYSVSRIIEGTPGDSRASSPLLAPGINIKIGDRIRAINGRRIGKKVSPQELLVHQADTEVILSVEDHEGKSRDVTVRTLRTEFPVRYREWVEGNRRLVHESTGGRVGYVHIPDMGANGFAEFHRTFLAEVAYDGLIVDVRYNRGGHVSQLLIEKLSRKRVGYDLPRWGQPEPYPDYSVAGPIVALTNQWAGSDGDIFSHVFKLKKLGTLIGKRTWGGVIGISPRNTLADGAVTTQPEYSFWFEDVGWGVENYGTDPDIDIDIAPQDYARGYDPQMEKAISVILEELEKNPVVKPSFTDRPNLALP
jgi:tricorn protease